MGHAIKPMRCLSDEMEAVPKRPDFNNKVCTSAWSTPKTMKTSSEAGQVQDVKILRRVHTSHIGLKERVPEHVPTGQKHNAVLSQLDSGLSSSFLSKTKP